MVIVQYTLYVILQIQCNSLQRKKEERIYFFAMRNLITISGLQIQCNSLQRKKGERIYFFAMRNLITISGFQKIAVI
jgi:hypothetical protein